MDSKLQELAREMFPDVPWYGVNFENIRKDAATVWTPWTGERKCDVVHHYSMRPAEFYRRLVDFHRAAQGLDIGAPHA